MTGSRRDFFKSCSALTVGSVFSAGGGYPSHAPSAQVVIDPEPRFPISPYLYMQFMEPLGATDSSVEAAWDYDADDWRRDLVEVVRNLNPGLIRFGGLFSRYYRWREGIGPVNKRPSVRNYVWGGKESNRVGTHEFVDFCRRVGAEPLYCVNFLSDGRRRYWKTRDEGVRTGDAQEAADWVSYANDPENRERKADGAVSPYNIKLWQLGNETSYGNDGFTKDESIRHTIEFARTMKGRDSSIQLIGWGDRGDGTGDPLWASDLLDRAGEFLDYVAIHMMRQHPTKPNSVLNSLRYQKEPELAWEELIGLTNATEARVKELEDVIASHKSKLGIAITEGHLSLRPRNLNPILREWLTGVFHARSMNIYQRHGAHVKIATAADFCGTRWTTNAVLLQVPKGLSYLMPAGRVMQLFKRHNGTHSVSVISCPSNLDIAASRDAGHIFLHVANLDYRRSVETSFVVKEAAILKGKVFEIAPEDLRQEVNEDQPDVFEPRVGTIPPSEVFSWRFPAGSVTAIELEVSDHYREN